MAGEYGLPRGDCLRMQAGQIHDVWRAIFRGLGCCASLLNWLGRPVATFVSGTWDELALQLLSPPLFSFQMRALGGSLVSAPPERPGDDVGWLDASLRQTCGNAADLLDRPANERLFRRRVRRIG